jgi:hypothetical protein
VDTKWHRETGHYIAKYRRTCNTQKCRELANRGVRVHFIPLGDRDENNPPFVKYATLMAQVARGQ